MKTVLITGASRGIGAETARLFHKKGYNVVINYNNSEVEAKKLQNELDGSLLIKADVSDEEQTKQMIEKATEVFGFVDVVVNNAGVSEIKLFTDITTENWNRMISVNLNSVYNVCKYAVPPMIRAKAGSIINVSSMWGVTGGSCEVHYSASKAGMIGFTKALAKELAPSNIRVNAVAPGPVMTDMSKHFDDETLGLIKEDIPLGRIGTAKDIAETIYFLASEHSSFITGQIIGANGGMII